MAKFLRRPSLLAMTGFELYEYMPVGDPTNVVPGFNSEGGYTSATITSASITTNTAVIIVAGQSNVACYGSDEHNPNSATSLMMNPYTGNGFRLKDPILGCSNSGTVSFRGSYVSYLAPKLITASVFAKVIIIDVAIGSSSVSDWDPASGLLYHRLQVAYNRCTGLGYNSNLNAHIMVLWTQGEQDNLDNMSKANYKAHWNSMKACLAGKGFSGPWFITSTSLVSGVVDANITDAQAELVNGSTVFAGGNLDSLTGATNRHDGIHFTSVGAQSAADLVVAKINLVF